MKPDKHWKQEAAKSDRWPKHQSRYTWPHRDVLYFQSPGRIHYWSLMPNTTHHNHRIASLKPTKAFIYRHWEISECCYWEVAAYSNGMWAWYDRPELVSRGLYSHSLSVEAWLYEVWVFLPLISLYVGWVRLLLWKWQNIWTMLPEEVLSNDERMLDIENYGVDIMSYPFFQRPQISAYWWSWALPTYPSAIFA